jgi:hypothetical protein
MPRYVALWEVDQSDPIQKGAGWSMLMALIRKDFPKGVLQDGGAFVGETNGLGILEGAELEVMNAVTQYVPFVLFRIHPVASEGQVNEMIKGLLAN